jgi:hypothetical protein
MEEVSSHRQQEGSNYRKQEEAKAIGKKQSPYYSKMKKQIMVRYCISMV